MVYMLRQYTRGGSLFKVGFAANYKKRLRAYSTHLAAYDVVAKITTYAKTKHHLETEIHKELINSGYEFYVDPHTGIQTEWVFIDSEHAEDFYKKNFSQFKCCKGRKILPGD